jgi:hypothetical protein
MQADLNRWQLGFNESKCTVLHFGRNDPKLDYQKNCTTLMNDTTEKNLGITIDSELKFHYHIAKAVNKAFRMLGLVQKTFTCLDDITVPRLYTAMVRSHLEYGNVIWSSRYKADCQEMEKIQRRATKLVPSVRTLPYE